MSKKAKLRTCTRCKRKFKQIHKLEGGQYCRDCLKETSRHKTGSPSSPKLF